MTSVATKAASLLVTAALAVLTSGCGAGGFGSAEPTALDTAIRSYVALGDGFAAAPYLGRTTTNDGCLRSEGNYPRRVAAQLGVETFVDVSCFETGTKALTRSVRSPISKQKLAAQIEAVDRDTDLVTLTTGLADQNLLKGLFKVCLTYPPCGSKIPVTELQNRLDTFGSALTAAVRKIQEKAPRAYIVLVGYPQLMPAQGACPALPDLEPAELNASYIVLQKINAAIQSAAQQTGSTYVNVAEISANHHACADTPWVHSDRSIVGKQKAFHPLAAEQAAVADEVVARVRTR